MSSKMFIELMGKLAGYEETMAGNICSIPVFAITAYTSYVGTQWWSNDPRELRSYVANRSSLYQTFLRILDALFRGIARGDTMSTVILLIGTLNSNLLPLAGVLAVVTAGGGAFTSYNRTFSRTEYVRLMPRESDSDSEDVFLLIAHYLHLNNLLSLDNPQRNLRTFLPFLLQPGITH